ncbi:hypothetical protein ALC57_00707 [Trachymyrmex cornetzi]|uniref:Uncharacterized protein n=1 Tax=Trachymyrmex cornetzi TaxID=471704 RepID=A0A151JR35_9HYME|nr:hypothetical protein ALC57_00707 [Trachymyrmex cornetzi]
MLYVSSVSSNPVADILWSPDEPDGGGSGLFRHVWISAFPASLVIIGCSLRVANVYTCPVSLATSNITCVPVSVDSSYACKYDVDNSISLFYDQTDLFTLRSDIFCCYLFVEPAHSGSLFSIKD